MPSGIRRPWASKNLTRFPPTDTQCGSPPPSPVTGRPYLAHKRCTPAAYTRYCGAQRSTFGSVRGHVTSRPASGGGRASVGNIVRAPIPLFWARQPMARLAASEQSPERPAEAPIPEARTHPTARSRLASPAGGATRQPGCAAPTALKRRDPRADVERDGRRDGRLRRSVRGRARRPDLQHLPDAPRRRPRRPG